MIDHSVIMIFLYPTTRKQYTHTTDYEKNYGSKSFAYFLMYGDCWYDDMIYVNRLGYTYSTDTDHHLSRTDSLYIQKFSNLVHVLQDHSFLMSIQSA